jgi:hypothetical protein
MAGGPMIEPKMKNPQALIQGKALLEQGYGLISQIEKMVAQSRERSVAVTQIEGGLLWLRQAIYLDAYEAPAENSSASEAKNL